MYLTKLVVFLAGAFNLASACPPGWIQNVDYCYYFSVINATWAGASSYCKAFNTKLAEPTTPEAMQFLSTEVHGHPVTNGNYGEYFMGGADIFVEKRWIWASDMEPITHTNWNPGEPNNNADLVYGGREDCLALTLSGKWNDVPCPIHLPFICETESGGDNQFG